MLENTNNENEVPVVLSEGEAIIPAEKVEDYVKEVEELLESSKPEEAAVEEPVSVPKPGPVQPALGVVGGGAMGVSDSTKVEKKPLKKVDEKVKSEKVAVFSTRNVTWSEVGKVYRGYNIVTPEQAEKWMTRDHIRMATPQEVAKEFGI